MHTDFGATKSRDRLQTIPLFKVQVQVYNTRNIMFHCWNYPLSPKSCFVQKKLKFVDLKFYWQKWLPRGNWGGKDAHSRAIRGYSVFRACLHFYWLPPTTQPRAPHPSPHSIHINRIEKLICWMGVLLNFKIKFNTLICFFCLLL